MAKRLTDKQKKRIIADYAESGSYNATAKKFGISHHTVKKLTLDDVESANKCQQKKEQNTLSMLEFMDSRKEQAQAGIQACLNNMFSEDRLAKTSMKDLAMVMAITFDKFVGADVKGIVNRNEDDKLTQALKNIAQDLKNE